MEADLFLYGMDLNSEGAESSSEYSETTASISVSINVDNTFYMLDVMTFDQFTHSPFRQSKHQESLEQI